MKDDYVRNAVLVRVIDGDTVELNIDMGFRTWKRERIRVLGINCPEITGPTKNAGLNSAAAVTNWFNGSNGKCIVRTYLDKTDSFGRVLAEIESPTGSNLAQWLLDNAYATPYPPAKAPVIEPTAFPSDCCQICGTSTSLVSRFVQCFVPNWCAWCYVQKK